MVWSPFAAITLCKQQMTRYVNPFCLLCCPKERFKLVLKLIGILSSSIDHKWSIGFKSGDWEGQSNFAICIKILPCNGTCVHGVVILLKGKVSQCHSTCQWFQIFCHMAVNFLSGYPLLLMKSNPTQTRIRLHALLYFLYIMLYLKFKMYLKNMT